MLATHLHGSELERVELPELAIDKDDVLIDHQPFLCHSVDLLTLLLNHGPGGIAFSVS